METNLCLPLKIPIFYVGLSHARCWSYVVVIDLTPTELAYSEKSPGKGKKKIALRDILSVRPSTDMVKKNVFEVQTRVPGSDLHRFAANTDEEMTEWIRAIDDARAMTLPPDLDTDSQSTQQSVMEDGFECVEDGAGFSVLPL